MVSTLDVSQTDKKERKFAELSQEKIPQDSRTHLINISTIEFVSEMIAFYSINTVATHWRVQWEPWKTLHYLELNKRDPINYLSKAHNILVFCTDTEMQCNTKSQLMQFFSLFF